MMQALLSFEQAPPLSAPMRFFLTAPLFAMLAGALLLYSGPDMFASRWTPSALALTHLITVGFMLQVMLGAMQQLLPVVAGANLRQPLVIAAWVHATITPGALFLAAAFLIGKPLLYISGVAFLTLGVVIFVWAAARALVGARSSNATIRGLKLALAGLSVTLLTGVLMAASLGLSLNFPLLQVADLHMGWGFMAWGCTVLAAVGFVTVPMFQLTPEYPAWFGRGFAPAALGAVMLWTLTDLVGWGVASTLLSAVVVAVATAFSYVTLNLLIRSKRPKRDASHHLWRVAMGSTLLACALWLAARIFSPLGYWQAWPLLFGILILFCGFMSVSIGMLGKIVPFLVWLHLQNRGRGQVLAPNVKKVLPQNRIDRQLRAHLLACTCLLLAVFWPAWFVYPAGLALIVANGELLRNLLYAVGIYRSHLVVISGSTAHR